MVGTSKILTVSYGTFSCTLEGFDEPFSTMRAIAEYFRELAADDRYFGAEPPTPDAEMLNRIAEREIKRRVESKIGAAGIILRTEASAAPAPDLPSAQPVPAEAASAFAGPVTSAADKLSRIRAVVSERGAALDRSAEVGDADLAAGGRPYGDVTDADFGFDLDLPAPPPVFGTHQAATAEPIAAAQADIDHGSTALADAATPFAMPAAMPAADESPMTDAGKVPTAAAIGHPAAITGDDSALGLILAADATTPMAASDTDYDDDDNAGTAAGTDMGGDPDGNFGTGFDDETDAHGSGAATATPDADPVNSDFIQRARAKLIKIRRNDAAPQPVFAAAPAAPRAAEPAEPAAMDDDDTSGAIDAAAAPVTTTDVGTGVGGKTPGRSAILDMGDDTLLADISAALGDTGLDAEDEAALMRELAEVARSATARDAHEGRAILEGAGSDDEADLSRLMEVAKTHLEGDENRRRFNAISHLKAAVAATVADRKMKVSDAGDTGDEGGPQEIDRYREDLSKVVRPHRPDTDDPSGQRGAPDQAPLVLVSEQRITPSRVAPATEALRGRSQRPDDDEDDADTIIAGMPSPETARNFAEFAERMGATGLSDLLEAAAVYTSTIEGLPHFSRPQILLKVAHVADDASYSREDGLRTFGMLLREGKIEKLRAGQFKVTDASKYLPDGRRA